MEEEIMLKSSLFGGYRKSDVIAYIDSVLDENEQRVNELYERIDDLTKENKQFKMKLKKARHVEGTNQEESDVIPFPQTLKQIKEETDLDSIRTEMEIPEGNYYIDEDEKVHLLANPTPEYRIKEEWKSSKTQKEASDIIKDNSAQKPVKQKAFLSASLIEESGLLNECQKEESEFLNQSQNEALFAEQKHFVQDNFYIEEMNQMQETILSLQKELEEVIKEREALKNKLEYSSDLLLNLYHGPNTK